MFFQNVRLMFWGEAVLCVVYIRNRCPSTTTNNKSPYELWYNRLPVVQHFRVFGSPCYALIPKQQRDKLGARSRKCLFLGYSNTSRSYRLYDEENKKFVISRDVVFLEFAKDASTIDRQLNHLDRFSSKKFYYEWDNDLPHPEGGIHILDQSVDFPSTTPENEITSKNEEKIVDSNVFDDNNVSVEEQLVDNNVPTEEKLEDNNGLEEPISNTLETEQTLQQSIHKSTRTKTMPKRFGEFELNFSTVNEPTTFEEATSCNEWKVAMQRV
jgi:hypothetical protein